MCLNDFSQKDYVYPWLVHLRFSMLFPFRKVVRMSCLLILLFDRSLLLVPPKITGLRNNQTERARLLPCGVHPNIRGGALCPSYLATVATAIS